MLPVLCEISVHRWSADASDLRDEGFVPGRWPEYVVTHLGNGLPFRRSRYEVSREGDELLWVDYVQCNGCLHLRVYND